jgi:hypothetical protein
MKVVRSLKGKYIKLLQEILAEGRGCIAADLYFTILTK